MGWGQDEKLHYYGGSSKNLVFRRGDSRKINIYGEPPKKGGLDSSQVQVLLDKKEEGGVFDGDGLP